MPRRLEMDASLDEMIKVAFEQGAINRLFPVILKGGV